jgi:hypothetical protein
MAVAAILFFNDWATEIPEAGIFSSCCVSKAAGADDGRADATGLVDFAVWAQYAPRKSEPGSNRETAAVVRRRFYIFYIGGSMRILLNIVGAILVFFGGVWFLQGINVLPGSFMTGQMKWAVYGGIAFVAGVIVFIWANRKKPAA